MQQKWRNHQENVCWSVEISYMGFKSSRLINALLPNLCVTSSYIITYSTTVYEACILSSSIFMDLFACKKDFQWILKHPEKIIFVGGNLSMVGVYFRHSGLFSSAGKRVSRFRPISVCVMLVSMIEK